ncbi:hypothetical protein [Roseococcus sp. YIM B11640]|uniref:hypothetical protein n=1 Tax=Roseococcus sp. YIM B11640 TaxID=3133973 RepID=UPI003C7C5279
MSVVRDGTIIRLEGPCRVEDAEPLVALLQRMPGSTVDLTSCEALHSAVLQALLAFRPKITGNPRAPFLAQWLPAITGQRQSEPPGA